MIKADSKNNKIEINGSVVTILDELCNLIRTERKMLARELGNKKADRLIKNVFDLGMMDDKTLASNTPEALFEILINAKS